MWIAIIVLAGINVVQWVILSERMENIEMMNTYTIREMWRIVNADSEILRDLRQDLHD